MHKSSGLVEGEDIKESQTSRILLVIVNNSMFWKISHFNFSVHRLCVIIIS